MLQKKRKPLFIKFVKSTAKTLFVIEAFAFVGSFAIWYRLNTNRDFRYFMRNNFPLVLEGYYYIGELADSQSQIRNLDKTVWATIKKSD